ncbi:hypothetical protein [Nocardioides bizhenqiangii]|uniref:Uncharacterized protein n=1 Tax=Nocardioides bizhenqiangii TaxID=3095076 RepID=A0ABZ0ZQ82_9ACTN|nr:hypothetical protein [Nocardioides sp. HM61]WQQ26443.1 hypothetical protein SHK19_21120 [Nocardioides sp. HM61]
MTEDASSAGSTPPRGTPNDPPPAATPADASGARPQATGSAPTPPPQSAQTAVVGAPPPPGGTTTSVMDPPPPPPAVAPEKPSRPGMGLLPIAIGVGLLAAAIALSATRSRADGDLDWSNYSVGLGATAVLVLVALAATVLGRGHATDTRATGSGTRALSANGRGREELVTWPGAIGVLGVGAMLVVGLEEMDGSEDWLAYLVGGVVVLLSVVGFVAVRRGAFVVTAILGLGIAYIQLADDVISDIGDDDDQAIIAAATIAVFVLAVTAVGWLLRTRAISGVVAGVIGLVGFNIVLIALVVVRAIGEFFGEFGMGGFDSDSGISSNSDYDNDVYIILAMAAVLTLLWALAAALDGNPGFTVLAIAMPATLVPMATFVLAVEHPTWWGVGLAGVGAVLLALVGLKQLLGRKRQH